MKLYHGTSQFSADKIINEGWSPNSWGRGGQCGNPSFLYLTTLSENASWYAQQKGDGVVIEVDIPDISYLRVDPEDGIADTVEEEMNLGHGLPGNVVLVKPLPANSFTLYSPSYGMRR